MNLLIGEADDPIPSFLQIVRPRRIVLFLECVAVPINLDNQLVRHAAEIYDAASDGMLATELQAAELLAAQPGPQLLLCWGLVTSQLSGPFLDGFGGALMSL
jgi:hypothetical protein